MNRRTLRQALEAIRARAERDEEAAIATARAALVVPFCDRTGLSFAAGMGTWAFYKPDGEPLGRDSRRIPKRVRDVLEADVLNRAQDAGSLMQDYTPEVTK